MNSSSLTFSEAIISFCLLFIFLLPFKLLKNKNKLYFAHPLIIFSVIMIYYSLISPITKIINYNPSFNRNIDYRELIIYGLVASLLSSCSIIAGYYSLKTGLRKIKKVECKIKLDSLWNIGLVTNFIGLLFFFISNGFNFSVFNPLSEATAGFDFLAYRGGFSNYFSYAINLLIPGNLLMVSSSLNTNKKYSFTFLNFFISILLFLSAHFRYRSFLLIFSIILYIIISGKIRPKLQAFLTFTSFSFLIIFQSALEILRDNYGRLFTTSFLKSFNLLNTIFNSAESTVFITTSGVIKSIPENMSFKYFYPIFKTLIHPFPSFLFDKNAGDYMFEAVFAFYQNNFISQGAAYLYYAEYYIMFGWLGIILFSFLLGFLFKKLWLWVNLHKDEPLAIIVYVLNVSYIFMIITRGYLPQQFHLYIFTVLPLDIIYIYNSRKVNSRNWIL